MSAVEAMEHCRRQAIIAGQCGDRAAVVEEWLRRYQRYLWGVLFETGLMD